MAKKVSGGPQGRLLRKPRLPTVMPQSPSSPSEPHDAQAILELAGEKVRFYFLSFCFISDVEIAVHLVLDVGFMW